jgi:hypothetical protein
MKKIPQARTRVVIDLDAPLADRLLACQEREHRTKRAIFTLALEKYFSGAEKAKATRADAA